MSHFERLVAFCEKNNAEDSPNATKAISMMGPSKEPTQGSGDSKSGSNSGGKTPGSVSVNVLVYQQHGAHGGPWGKPAIAATAAEMLSPQPPLYIKIHPVVDLRLSKSVAKSASA